MSEERWITVATGVVVTLAATALVCAGGSVMMVAGFQRELSMAGGAAEPPRATAMDSAKDADVMVNRQATRGKREEARKRPKPRPRPAPAPASKGLMKPKELAAAAIDEEEGEEDAPDDANGGGSGAQVRSWFPESFLWQPMVQTGDDGVTLVDVTVPDTLTTWRVLALAHDRSGGQAGAVHSFDSTLPLYVEPVVPGWLYAGDTVLVPVQVVNGTADPVQAGLTVEASGALEGAGVARVQLAGWGSDVLRQPLTTTASGQGQVLAALAGADAARRSIPVLPTGRPVERARGGTLGGPRSFRMKGPEGADPKTEELEVRVYPGPLALLQSEVERASRGVPNDVGYGFALTHYLQTLSTQAGLDVDARAVRRLQLVSWQRIARVARAPSPGQAADLLAAIGRTEDHDLAAGLQRRLVRTVVDGQRADGTWARQQRGSLQQVIVQTAFAARTLPDSEQGPRLRAAGALERFARDVKDPYTAAVVLASGVVSDTIAEHLREVLRKGLAEETDGTRRLVMEPDVVNAWGRTPPRPEALAWVTLALLDMNLPDATSDIVAELMGGYDARRGFGAGPADAIALEAVSRAMPPIANPIEVVLTLDGREVSRATVDPTQPRVPAVLTGKTRAQNPEIGLKAEPALPGLAYVAGLASWVAWSGEEGLLGVEVEAKADPLAVGRDSRIVLTVSAPSTTSVTLEQGIPAGASVLPVNAVGVVDHEVFTDRVRITTRAFQAGEIIEIPIVVRPAFSGTFSTLPLSVTAAGRTAQMAPLTWTVD